MRTQHDHKMSSKIKSMSTNRHIQGPFFSRSLYIYPDALHLTMVMDTVHSSEYFRFAKLSKKPSEEVKQHKEKGHNMALPQPSTAVIGSTPLIIGLHLGHVLPPILERSTTVI